MDNPYRSQSSSPPPRFEELLKNLKHKISQLESRGNQALEHLCWANLVVARLALMTDLVGTTDTEILGKYSAKYRDIQPDLSRYSKLSIRHFLLVNTC
jgi:hypothetical protein